MKMVQLVQDESGRDDAPRSAQSQDESSGEFLNRLGTDAVKWAEEFCKRYPTVPEDEAMGWFANAMMAMWDLTNSDITHDDTALADHISGLIRNRDLWRELADTEPA